MQLKMRATLALRSTKIEQGDGTGASPCAEEPNVAMAHAGLGEAAETEAGSGSQAVNAECLPIPGQEGQDTREQEMIGLHMPETEQELQHDTAAPSVPQELREGLLADDTTEKWCESDKHECQTSSQASDHNQDAPLVNNEHLYDGEILGSATDATDLMETRETENDGRRKCQMLDIELNRRVKACTEQECKPIWKMSAKEILDAPKFDNVCGSLILMNAITIGVQADYAAKHKTDVFPHFYQVAERIFCVAFTAELCLRIYALRCTFFCGGGTKFTEKLWNYFDLFVVAAQLLEEVVALVASNADIDISNFRLLRVLRVLRLVRILRVVRVLRLISELRTIVSSIMGSFKSLGWTMVLLLLMIYIVGVYFTQSVTDHMIARNLQIANNLSDGHTEGELALEYYFGTLARTILTLWEAISGGEDWDRMAGPLVDEVALQLGFAFTAYIAFAILALMNVVTGFFVHTALLRAKQEEDVFIGDQIVSLFNRSGPDERYGRITLEDTLAVLTDPEAAAEWKAINVTITEATYLFQLLDVDCVGEISFDEFLSGCLRIHGMAKSMDLLTVLQEIRVMARANAVVGKTIEEINGSIEKIEVRFDEVEKALQIVDEGSELEDEEPDLLAMDKYASLVATAPRKATQR
jgi:hypothetical protein